MICDFDRNWRQEIMRKNAETLNVTMLPSANWHDQFWIVVTTVRKVVSNLLSVPNLLYSGLTVHVRCWLIGALTPNVSRTLQHDHRYYWSSMVYGNIITIWNDSTNAEFSHRGLVFGLYTFCKVNDKRRVLNISKDKKNIYH